jgi:hypothetical protein
LSERAVSKIKSQDAVGILRDADPDTLPNLAGFIVTVRQP